MTVEVFRYDPADDDGETRFDSYEVPYQSEWVVLDALNWIKDELDGSLTFRWSCRMGVCGSCGMMVNGLPKLTCATFLKEYYPAALRIEPLANFPIERDLVTGLDDFMAKLKSVKPWIVRDDVDDVEKGEYRQSPAELAQYKQYSMCINCLLCYSACPEYAFEPDFVGPAAIALAQRYNLDSRDRGNAERQEVLGSSEGVYQCTFIGECSAVCPKHVDPAAAIQQAKVASTIDWYKRLLMPWSDK